ncbi:MAG: DUF4350 domain-containing protein [Erythrobacter sp.]
MSAATGGPAFSRGGVLALVVGGFALFLAMLYLIGAGEDFGGERGAGEAHATSNGLNGYAGLVRLVEAQGYSIERSRNQEGLKTCGLLVIAPSAYADAEEIGKLLAERSKLGPTLVIMPKWFATTPSPALPPKVREKFKRNWVLLASARVSDWPEELPAPYRFKHKAFPESESDEAMELPVGAGPVIVAKPAKPPPPGRWGGMGLSGALPASPTLYAEPSGEHDTLIMDASGRILAFGITPAEEEDSESEAYPVYVLADADLANNYGLADPKRAAAILALIDELTYGGDIENVTFDMTLNGFGASENLLTLAFRPPFLAATLSLLVALLIVGWRAFQRFGPPATASGPDIAFGKRQLIMNGAGLIVRARRFGLLAHPYAALSARRLAERLGLSRPDPEAIDAALARRLPTEEPFTRRAARLEAAQTSASVLAAARGLDDLATKLTQGQ